MILGQRGESGKNNYLVVLVFMDEYTIEYNKKILETLTRMATREDAIIFFIDKCDVEELLFLKAVVSISKEYCGLSLNDIIEISAYVVLVYKYSKSLKSLYKRQLSDNEYYDYQLSVEYTSRYLSKLIKLCSIYGIDIEKLLMSIGDDVGFNELTLREFQKVFNLTGSSSFVFPNRYNPDCSRSLINVIVDVWRETVEKDPSRNVFLVVPQVLIMSLVKYIPRDYIIGV
ncbi:MAG: hypothetical protein QXE81_06555 [Desulfurococcaceae archaeon]